MNDQRYNFGVGFFIVIVAAILAGFLVSLLGARSGEIASALGSIIGGALGALGAALAVYIMLAGQREDEIEKISAAIFAEIMALAKFPMGQLEMCEAI